MKEVRAKMIGVLCQRAAGFLNSKETSLSECHQRRYILDLSQYVARLDVFDAFVRRPLYALHSRPGWYLAAMS
jgi:hypothetical protein